MRSCVQPSGKLWNACSRHQVCRAARASRSALWECLAGQASGLGLCGPGQGRMDTAKRLLPGCAAEPEEEGGSIPLVEVHRTPSTGSWLGMVRRRIAGGAGKDEDGSGSLVRSFSLPKQRRSGQGATLKARPRQLPRQLPSSLLS